MKSLIYGIDGGDERIFDYFDMPFYQQLKRSYKSIPLKEDLISRGWSEILTGAHGKDSGGFYMVPNLDGSASMSMAFKMGEVTQNTGIPLLWDALGEKVRVGVMNVPSLNPVIKLNGFAVGSAGAGISKIDSIDERIAYPQTTIDFLNEVGYVPDIRLGPSGVTDIEELFIKLKEMESIRVNSFIHLAKSKKIEFGVLIDRGTTVVQYLLMSEIKALMDRDSGRDPLFLPSKENEELLRDYYLFVDNNIRMLVEAFESDQFIIVGDHGHEPMTHHCNPHVLLKENGWFYPGATGSGSSFSRVKERLFRAIPRIYRSPIRTMLSSKLVTKLEQVGEGFDKNKTKAFSHWYMPGIYINDDRFYGVVDAVEKVQLVEEICEAFNSNRYSLEFGVSASPYREKFEGAKFYDKLPDIRLNLPDTIFTTCRCNSYIAKNPEYGPVLNLNNVQSDMHTGNKGANPICLVDPGSSMLIEEFDQLDLTLVYKLVVRHFQA